LNGAGANALFCKVIIQNLNDRGYTSLAGLEVDVVNG
jgi:hypothetical protein